MIAGIDFSTRAVDIVLLDEDSDAATWHRFELREYMSEKVGSDAFDRTRDVRPSMPGSSFWDDVMAVGIEDPRGFNAGALYRIQGAILSCIPTSLLIHPLVPSSWRKTVGLPGGCAKAAVEVHVHATCPSYTAAWPQDACDAYCIALATRSLLQHGEQAA